MLKNLLFSALIACVSINSFSQEKWILKKHANNIRIYTRAQEDFSFDEYKAVTLVNTSITNVLKELIEAPKYYENCPP